MEIRRAFEQRTGRLDRVGSLSERLYQVDPQQHRLDIGVPFLAFDYDEFRFKTTTHAHKSSRCFWDNLNFRPTLMSGLTSG